QRWRESTREGRQTAHSMPPPTMRNTGRYISNDDQPGSNPRFPAARKYAITPRMKTPTDSIVRPIQPKLVSPPFVREYFWTSMSGDISRGRSGLETAVGCAGAP